MMAELPSPKLRDHPEYLEAVERYQRVKAEVDRLQREYAAKAANAGRSRQERRREFNDRLTDAFLEGDFQAALEPDPDYESEVAELARLVTVAERAQAIARQRVDGAKAAVARKVSQAYRPEYERRLKTVAQKIAELMAAVEDADACGDALRIGQTHCPRTLSLPRLDFFRRSKVNPRNGARSVTAAEIALRELRKYYGIEVKAGGR